jgi:imidazoleglycerol phosphate synthase glutamine amidotransferase subunit HisH
VDWFTNIPSKIATGMSNQNMYNYLTQLIEYHCVTIKRTTTRALEDLVPDAHVSGSVKTTEFERLILPGSPRYNQTLRTFEEFGRGSLSARNIDSLAALMLTFAL